MNYKLDNDKQIFFYEQEYYCLSNFSAFTLNWCGKRFDTSEAAYHWEKFNRRPDIQTLIHNAISAHEAFQIAQAFAAHRRSDWDEVRVEIMKQILKEKVRQHPYVLKKLLQSRGRILIEDSWRDDFWGWGPNKDGQNMLGKIWMEIREKLINEKY